MDCGRSLNPAVDVGQVRGGHRAGARRHVPTAARLCLTGAALKPCPNMPLHVAQHAPCPPPRCFCPQVEGALAQGLGMVLSEERRMCAATGRLLTDSLWHYHAPTAAAMPRQLNVCLLPVRGRVLGCMSDDVVSLRERPAREFPLLPGCHAMQAQRLPACRQWSDATTPDRPDRPPRLQGSRLERSTLSAKAVGEPPLMLAASALSALQAAVRAGRAELAALGASSGGPSSGGASSNGGGGEDGSERLASGGCEGSDGDASLLQLPASVDHVMAALCGARGRDLAAAVRAAASDAR